MESLKWVAYEEYSYAESDSDDDVVKANDREVSPRNSDSTESEKAESDHEG